MTQQFDNVSVAKQANVYFDGQCISYNLIFADGSKKSVGMIFPSRLSFNTGAPEVMELLAGKCVVKLAGENESRTYCGGESFNAPGNASFEIETLETLHYVCHFG